MTGCKKQSEDNANLKQDFTPAPADNPAPEDPAMSPLYIQPDPEDHLEQMAETNQQDDQNAAALEPGEKALPEKMATSIDGVRFIKTHEGSVIDDDGIHRMYEDQAGKLTIGYGHLIRPGELASGIYEHGLSEEQAEELLAKDLGDAEDAVRRLIKVPITQNQFDAMVSFAFNLGPGALKNLAEVVNKRDWKGAAAKIALYNKVTDPATGKKITSRGLLKRRTMEVALFESNAPPGTDRYIKEG